MTFFQRDLAEGGPQRLLGAIPPIHARANEVPQAVADGFELLQTRAQVSFADPVDVIDPPNQVILGRIDDRHVGFLPALAQMFLVLQDVVWRCGAQGQIELGRRELPKPLHQFPQGQPADGRRVPSLQGRPGTDLLGIHAQGLAHTRHAITILADQQQGHELFQRIGVVAFVADDQGRQNAKDRPTL
jgi:hypothetical protein